MKLNDRVYSVKGGRKPGLSKRHVSMGGPFEGRVVGVPCGKTCEPEAGCENCCHAIIKKPSGQRVRCLLRNLRPYGNGAAYRKARKEWER
jgi:hypothetical protein